MRNGVSPQWAGNPAIAAGYGKSEAAIIVVEAAQNMCPDQLPTMQRFIDGEIPMQPRGSGPTF
jgi:hypothetical protein